MQIHQSEEAYPLSGKATAQIEFAEPHTYHRRTWQALYKLIEAMEADVEEHGDGNFKEFSST